ncbi:FAD/NAD(P)-binding domain-containing protein [Xylariaceae sp. FL1272]|nr:FAD/NAD(P)-binding domain-containing protein [Xylariaceae sp. FL1272]
MDKVKIAVIGLGPAGLSALKNLREKSFDAIAFERRDKIGGLWAFNSAETYTSVLDETLCNVSKFVSGFSDFPVPKDASTYPTSQEVAEYFEGNASKFGLHPHIRFGSTVNRVTRNEADDKWDVHITTAKGAQTLPFDKVVFGHGTNGIPSYPSMPNRNKFKGTVIHGQSFKGPESFAGKRVLVVGIGNSACDASLSLINHASKVYQSYRRGRITMSEPANAGDSPTDSWKRMEQLVHGDWRLLSAASMAHDNPSVQEDFIPALRRGAIVPMRGFKDFCGESEVLLAGGMIVEVDAVIFCTGYELDFSIMPEIEMEGACGIELQTAGDIINKRAVRRERRDHEIFRRAKVAASSSALSDDLSTALGILGSFSELDGASGECMVRCGTRVMAVAQIWAGETAGKAPMGNRDPAKFPSLEEMNQEVDAYQIWWRQQWQEEQSMLPGYVRAYSFYRFLHNAAGTGPYERLDHMFTTRGWGLWWNDNELWTWLAKGPMNSYSWRLFETNPGHVPGCGRKTWPEARQALKEAISYEIFQDHKRQHKDKAKNE